MRSPSASVSLCVFVALIGLLAGPEAAETCNHVDDDGDGLVDEGFAQVTSAAVLADTTWGGNFFGRALAVLGDVDGDDVADLVVGYPGDHATGSWRGSARVISGASGALLCTAVNDDLLGGGELGNQVVTLGDVDGDDVPDFAAAAWHSDAVATDAGEVVVFSGADCSVVCHAQDPAGASQDLLGEENALGRVDDVTGDGVPDLLAGAPHANAGGLSDSGKALVFSGADCTPVLTLVDPAAAAYDYLGASVAGLPDVSGDGVPDIAVGESRGDDTASDGGAVLVFSGADGSFLARWTDPAAFVADYLGWAMVLLDDVDGDGLADLAVAARNRPPAGGYEVGEVLAFSTADGSVLWRGADPEGATRDYLGWSLATTPDHDGDGLRDVLAGAPYADLPDKANVGYAVLFSGADGSYLRRLEHPDSRAQDSAGFAVAGPGDLNGDGAPDFALGVGLDDIPKHDVDRGTVALLYPESDCDGDGYGPTGIDCDDAEATVCGGAHEICDGLDNDCDGDVDEDEDGDGFDVCAEWAACDPGDAPEYDRGMHPGAEERCNGLDDDCDGVPDDGPDADGDLWSLPCDCDDGVATVHPGAVELCNHVADACGAVDATFAPAMVLEKHVDRLTDASDQFGYALAAIGDVTGDGVSDFAVSAPWDQTVGWQAGLVTVRSGADRSVWCRSSEPIGYALGTMLAAVGDWSGDGVPDVAASIPGANGAVVLSGADCLEVARCTETAPGSWNLGSELGLAAWADVTGDGVVELLAGAASNTERLHHQGKAVAFRYDRTTGACTILHQLWDPEGAVYDNLGNSLAGIDDVTGDGVPDIAVGEPGDDSLVDQNGAVVVFSGADGSFVRRMTDPAAAAQHRIGRTVAALDDVDGDGVGDLAAGGQYANRVVLFSGRTGAVIRRLSDPLGGSADRLGWNVAAIDDLDGDGARDVAAGAPYADAGGVVDSGRVVLFSTGTGDVLGRLQDDVPTLSRLFGSFVADGRDLDGDGVPEVLVGVPAQDPPGAVNGGAFGIGALQAECDGDGVTPFAGDCDDTDPDLWRLPTEVTGLLLAPDKQTLSWLPPAEPGTGGGTLLYDVLRAEAPGPAFLLPACPARGGAATSATDPAAPLAGACFYYLVRATNGCGAGDVGTWGEEELPREAGDCLTDR